MLLRRISEHVRNQNWFAVCIDLVVVIVGIYIGLQADSWMSAQRDRALEREYVERLLADMQDSVAAQRAGIESMDRGIAATDYIAELQRKQSFEGLDRDRLVLGLNWVGWVVAPETNMVTIRELQSTGNVALIRDVELRKAIGRFERSYSEAEFSANLNMQFVSAAAPEFMDWSFMAPRVPGSHRSVTEEEDASYGYVHNWDVDSILDNPDGANITSWVTGWAKYQGAVLQRHHLDTIEFRDLLERKLATLD